MQEAWAGMGNTSGGGLGLQDLEFRLCFVLQGLGFKAGSGDVQLNGWSRKRRLELRVPQPATPRSLTKPAPGFIESQK